MRRGDSVYLILGGEGKFDFFFFFSWDIVLPRKFLILSAIFLRRGGKKEYGWSPLSREKVEGDPFILL